MPEDTQPSPEKPKVRRVSNKNPKQSPDPSGKPEAPETAEVAKKKSRRRRKGKSPREEDVLVAEETSATVEGKLPEGKAETSGGQRPQQPPRRKPDPEKIAKNAWKIFLAEVSEEGVALIGDNEARELARRCFRLSEIFLEEAGRRS
ncbi:hypothetical protein HZ994_14160 [Akkermansiaceae bacterium]|nr:hypothetical protein HZ994_14160 [Akkermansiaceae bacterium]